MSGKVKPSVGLSAFILRGQDPGSARLVGIQLRRCGIDEGISVEEKLGLGCKECFDSKSGRYDLGLPKAACPNGPYHSHLTSLTGRYVLQNIWVFASQILLF